MAPTTGLVISRLGVQATASGDTATGLLCLKVTLPKGTDGRQAARWSLFSGTPPALLSIPALYPLPAPLALLRAPKSSSPDSPTPFRNLQIATALLSLPPPTQYPPSSHPGPGVKPYIDVSATSGQVYVVVDPLAGTGHSGARRQSLPRKDLATSRSEWLVVVEFQVPIEFTGEGLDEMFKVVLPTPKCLDNVIRFHILPNDQASSTEVNIITEPKVLPVAASTFLSTSTSSSSLRRGSKPMADVLPPRDRIGEDDWEDGEVPGVYEDGESVSDNEVESEPDQSEDGAGSWLEGRFQSTDALRLEWSFIPSTGCSSDLCVTPKWDDRQASIEIAYETTLKSTSDTVSFDIVVPHGWGWRDLEIRADELIEWQSIDGDASLCSTVGADALDDDKSFSTVQSYRTSIPSYLTPSRIAPLGNGHHLDFSFEHSFDDSRPSRPSTPSLRRSLTAERRMSPAHKVVPREPVVGNQFELSFRKPEREERVLLVQGTLVPLSPLTLVSPSAPMSIPFIRFEDPELPTHCIVTCPNSLFLDDPESTRESSPSSAIQVTTGLSIGTFAWTDASGQLVDPRRMEPVSGPIQLNVRRSIWGIQTISATFPWPKRAAEVILKLPPGSVRVVRATSGGSPLARAVIALPGSQETQIILGVRDGPRGGSGPVELVLEATHDHGVVIPSFPGGTGQLSLELVGDNGWDKLLAQKMDTNLVCISDRSFHIDLDPAAQAPYIIFTSSNKSKAFRGIRARTLLSWSTLFNLFLVWILVSLAQQVQRLRVEVAFVADEARDLRLYGFESRLHDAPEDSGQERGWLGDAAGLGRETRHVAEDSTVTFTSAAPVPLSSGIWSSDNDEPRIDQSTDTLPGVADKSASLTVPSYGLGRVVWGGTGWDAWATHPTLRTLSTTVTWLWNAVRWLVVV